MTDHGRWRRVLFDVSCNANSARICNQGVNFKTRKASRFSGVVTLRAARSTRWSATREWNRAEGNSGYMLGCNGWFDRVAVFLVVSSTLDVTWCREMQGRGKRAEFGVGWSTGRRKRRDEGGEERGMNV